MGGKMKCDELKPLMCAHNPNVRPMYDKYLVDEAIAELKQALHDAEMAKDDAEAANTEYRLDIEKLKDKIQMHDFFWEGNGFDKMEFKNTIQVREYIDKLKAENAELKFKLKKINDNFAIKAKLVYERHERHTLRELWLARAERAKARKDYWYVRSCHEGDKRLWSIDGSPVKYIGCIKRTNFDWLKIWSEVECKCLKKMEKYK